MSAGEPDIIICIICNSSGSSAGVFASKFNEVENHRCSRAKWVHCKVKAAGVVSA